MRLIPILFILICAIRVSAQQGLEPKRQGEDRVFLEHKLQKFQGMQTTGFVLGGLGGAALLGGIILAANGSWETQNTQTGTQANATDGAAVGGVILILAGAPMLVTGIILGAIGSKKVHQYQNMLNAVSLDLRPGHTGLRLAYSF